MNNITTPDAHKVKQDTEKFQKFLRNLSSENEHEFVSTLEEYAKNLYFIMPQHDKNNKDYFLPVFINFITQKHNETSICQKFSEILLKNNISKQSILLCLCVTEHQTIVKEYLNSKVFVTNEEINNFFNKYHREYKDVIDLTDKISHFDHLQRNVQQYFSLSEALLERKTAVKPKL